MQNRRTNSTGFRLLRFIPVLAITIILVLWAKYTGSIVKLPLPPDSVFEYVLLSAGFVFLCVGIWSRLRSVTPEAVNYNTSEKAYTRGIYSITDYPVYAGAVLISFGLSAVLGSSSGFWLVSPMFTLMAILYAATSEIGLSRSTNDINAKPFLSLPPVSDRKPFVKERISSCLLVFVPWLIIYKAFIFIGAPKDAVSTNLPLEEHFPIWEYTVVFYSLAFLYSLLVPFILNRSDHLRSFITDVWFTIVFVGIIYLVFPLIVRQKVFVPESVFGRIIMFERSIDGQSGALPSCHVIWAFLAADYFTRRFPRFAWIWFTAAVVITASCITIGAHSLLDVIAGFLTWLVIIYRFRIWEYIIQQVKRRSAIKMGRRSASVEFPFQALLRGASAFTAVFLTVSFTGRQQRPDLYILVASLAMAAPWSLAIARLGNLTGVSQAYAVKDHYSIKLSLICADIITGLILVRLFNSGASCTFIAGIFLILNGAGFYSKESYLNKSAAPELKTTGRSHRAAIALIMSGILLTTLPGGHYLVFNPDLLSLLPAIITSMLVIAGSLVKERYYRESEWLRLF